MNVSNFKDLEKLIKIMRKQGVEFMQIDNMKIHLGHLPQQANRTALNPFTPPTPIFTPGGITEDTPVPQVETDELTEEQLMMWSVGDQTAE